MPRMQLFPLGLRNSRKRLELLKLRTWENKHHRLEFRPLRRGAAQTYGASETWERIPGSWDPDLWGKRREVPLWLRLHLWVPDKAGPWSFSKSANWNQLLLLEGTAAARQSSVAKVMPSKTERRAPHLPLPALQSLSSAQLADPIGTNQQRKVCRVPASQNRKSKCAFEAEKH